MKLKPLGNRILAKKLDLTPETNSGLLLAKATQNLIEFSEIVGIENLITEQKLKGYECLEQGARIVTRTHTGLDIVFGGEHFTLYELNEILGIIEV